MKTILLFLIKIYQYFSRFTSKKCRFYPSCSSYSHEAVDKYGVFKGSVMSLLRITKCHPWHPGGYDPVK